MMNRLVAEISGVGRLLPAGDSRRVLLARMLLIALLIWVLGLAPFVHAHAGSAHTRGWHLHTDIGTVSLLSAPQHAQPEVTPRTALERSPEGPDARAVGVGAGLPQGRDAVAEPVQAAPPDELPQPHWPAMPKPVDGTQRDVGLISLRLPGPLLKDVAGLPPPNRAPPFQAD